MKPSAPKKLIWIIALVLGVLGIVGHFAQVQYLTQYNFQLLLAGFVLLALGTTLKDF